MTSEPGARECSDVCPSGSTLPDGAASDAEFCQCTNANSFLDESTALDGRTTYACRPKQECPAGFYCPTEGTARECPEHSISEAGSTALSACQCLQGFFGNPGEQQSCTQCQLGYYTIGVGATECVECTEGIPCECLTLTASSVTTRKNVARTIANTVGRSVNMLETQPSPRGSFTDLSFLEGQVRRQVTGTFPAGLSIIESDTQSCSTTKLSSAMSHSAEISASGKVKSGSVTASLSVSATASATERTNLLVTTCTVGRYEVMMDHNVGITPTEVLKSKFKQTAQDNSENDWDVFFMQYGTHIITGGTMGGGFVSTVDTCEFESEKAAEVAAKAAYENQLYSVAGSATSGTQEETSNSRSSDRCNVFGANMNCNDMLAQQECFIAAKSQFEAQAIFVQLDVIPITSLPGLDASSDEIGKFNAAIKARMSEPPDEERSCGDVPTISAAPPASLLHPRAAFLLLLAWCLLLGSRR